MGEKAWDNNLPTIKKSRAQAALMKRARKLYTALQANDTIKKTIVDSRLSHTILEDIAKIILLEIMDNKTYQYLLPTKASRHIGTIRAAVSLILEREITLKQRQEIQKTINEAKQAKRIHAIRGNHPNLFTNFNAKAQKRWIKASERDSEATNQKRREVGLAWVEEQWMKAFSKEEILRILYLHKSLPRSKKWGNKREIIANTINREFHDNESVRSKRSIKNCYERYNGRDLELVFTSSQNPLGSPLADPSATSRLWWDQPTADDSAATASADQAD